MTGPSPYLSVMRYSGYFSGALYGSDFGTLIRGREAGHFVFGVPANDGNDSFAIVGPSDFASPAVLDRLLLNVTALGRLGVNSVSFPSTTLHISGTLRMADGGETCDADRAGAMRWHAESGQFQVCYGSGSWALLSSAAISGTALTDRIVSGTSSIIASQDRSVVRRQNIWR